MAKSKITLPLEDWCRLCDALSVSPDTPINEVISKAKIQALLLRDARKAWYELQQEKESVNRDEVT